MDPFINLYNNAIKIAYQQNILPIYKNKFSQEKQFIMLTVFGNYDNVTTILQLISTMACSKYQYVKEYENHSVALMQTYLVVRIDGRGFTKFCNAHNFKKPNDLRAIQLMNEAALYVVEKFQDIFLAYGQSDQYSFVLSKNSQLFNRRIDKIETCLVSAFTSSYVHNWGKFFMQTPLTELPSFDARIILYPNLDVVKDYFRWRQVDCHINNLYNTTFWCMVKKGMKNTEVENKLKDTNSGQKNQILFSQFQINYNQIEDVYRKGTIICYKYVDPNKQESDKLNKTTPKIVKQLKTSIREIHEASSNTDRIINKLAKSEIKEDVETSKQFQVLRDELQRIKDKYKEIDTKMRERVKYPGKEKAKKLQLKRSYQDLIKEEFWESIKIE